MIGKQETLERLKSMKGQDWEPVSDEVIPLMGLVYSLIDESFAEGYKQGYKAGRTAGAVH